MKVLPPGNCEDLEKGSVCKVIDILPASAKTLTMGFGSKAKTVLATLEGLQEDINKTLPKFERLILTTRWI